MRVNDAKRDSLAAVFKHDPIIVLAGLAGLSLLSWAYMVYAALDMKQAASSAMYPLARSPGAIDGLFIFIMWVVMMVAMMVPSAGPMIIMFAQVNRRRHTARSPITSTAVFLAGYLAAWIGYSALAAAAQCGLQRASLLSPMMASNNAVLGGSLLVMAGFFQFTPLKYACLKRCRSPLGFLLNEWREGSRGAFMMGLRNGHYCVGCCWALMLLMLVAGVMSVVWMAIIACYILVEKVAPGGRLVSRISGMLMSGGGLWMLFGKFILN